MNSNSGAARLVGGAGENEKDRARSAEAVDRLSLAGEALMCAMRAMARGHAPDHRMTAEPVQWAVDILFEHVTKASRGAVKWPSRPEKAVAPDTSAAPDGAELAA